MWLSTPLLHFQDSREIFEIWWQFEDSLLVFQQHVYIYLRCEYHIIIPQQHIKSMHLIVKSNRNVFME